MLFEDSFYKNLINIIHDSTESVALSKTEVDGDFRLIFINDTYVKLINNLSGKNYAADDLSNKLHSDLFLNYFQTSEAILQADNDRRQAAITQRKKIYEEEVYVINNASLYLETCITPFFDEQGVCTHTLFTARNITERKNIEIEKEKLYQQAIEFLNVLKHNEEELLKINEELVGQNQQLSQFSFIVSHNLRGPVASLLGLSKLINEDLVKPEEFQDVIKYIHRTSENLDIIIRDLNTILSQTRELDTIREEIDLEGVYKQVCDLYQKEIQDSGAAIEMDFSAAPTLYGIRSFMQSIFTNLLSNSLKYKQFHAKPHIRVSSFVHDEIIVISHQDNGLGIDLEKNRENLFGFYKRFHHHVEGKGLGLHLVKTQTEMMGGIVNVKSELNQGAEFIFTFSVKK